MRNALPALIVAAFALGGLVAIVAIARDDARQRVDTMAPVGPARVAAQYHVECPPSDEDPAEILVPMDGGTAGRPMKADSIYIAPISDGGVDIRVGFGEALTASTGFVVGPTGRDGAGMPAEVTESSDPRCISTTTDPAKADVVVGRQ